MEAARARFTLSAGLRLPFEGSRGPYAQRNNELRVTTAPKQRPTVAMPPHRRPRTSAEVQVRSRWHLALCTPWCHHALANSGKHTDSWTLPVRVRELASSRRGYRPCYAVCATPCVGTGRYQRCQQAITVKSIRENPNSRREGVHPNLSLGVTSGLGDPFLDEPDFKHFLNAILSRRTCSSPETPRPNWHKAFEWSPQPQTEFSYSVTFVSQTPRSPADQPLPAFFVFFFPICTCQGTKQVTNDMGA